MFGVLKAWRGDVAYGTAANLDLFFYLGASRCFFFFFWLCHLTHEILVPRLGIKPTPMHWECGVLITGQPRELPLGLLLTAVWCGYDEPLQIHGLSGWWGAQSQGTRGKGSFIWTQHVLLYLEDLKRHESGQCNGKSSVPTTLVLHPWCHAG